MGATLGGTNVIDWRTGAARHRQDGGKNPRCGPGLPGRHAEQSEPSPGSGRTVVLRPCGPGGTTIHPPPGIDRTWVVKPCRGGITLVLAIATPACRLASLVDAVDLEHVLGDVA